LIPVCQRTPQALLHSRSGQQRSRCCREQKRTRSSGAARPRKAEQQQQQEHEKKQKILFYCKGIMDAACDKPVKCDADLLALELQSSECK
jgi:hypothetical protein